MTTAKKNVRHRSFTSKSSQIREPLSFDLEGRSFECHPALPGAVLLDFVSASDAGGGAVAAQIMKFYSKVLTPESLEEFNEFVYNTDTVIDEEVLGDIIAWLVEEYTSRPTQASEQSSSTS